MTSQSVLGGRSSTHQLQGMERIFLEKYENIIWKYERRKVLRLKNNGRPLSYIPDRRLHWCKWQELSRETYLCDLSQLTHLTWLCCPSSDVACWEGGWSGAGSGPAFSWSRCTFWECNAHTWKQVCSLSFFRTTEPVRCVWKHVSLLSVVRMTASCKVGKAREKKGGAGVLPLTLSRQLMPSRERRGPL